MRTDEVSQEAELSSGTETDDNRVERASPRSDDSNSGVATLHGLLEQLAEGVGERRFVGVVVFDATPLERWEHRHGPDQFDALLDQFAAETERLRGSALREDDLVCRNAPGGGSVLVFLALARPRSDPRASESLDFDAIADRAKEYVVASIPDGDRREAIERLQVGTSLIVGKKSIDPRRQIYRSIRRARDDIRNRKRKRIEHLHQVVGSVIAQRDIETLYQPIVRLDEQRPIGFEALSRVGNERSRDLDDPLFSAAAEVELEAELDKICRNLSIHRRPDLDDCERLFINCLPAAFYDPDRQLENLLDQWKRNGLDPEQLIFEINEDISQSEADRILPTIRRLRRSGFQFALDDTGTGKTNLRLLAELEPTYIKMDISLTRGIGESVRKQALASYLLDLAEKGDAELIAEGVESQRDLETIVELGVEYAQGYLIGRPGADGEFV